MPKIINVDHCVPDNFFVCFVHVFDLASLLAENVWHTIKTFVCSRILINIVSQASKTTFEYYLSSMDEEATTPKKKTFVEH